MGSLTHRSTFPLCHRSSLTNTFHFPIPLIALLGENCSGPALGCYAQPGIPAAGALGTGWGGCPSQQHAREHSVPPAVPGPAGTGGHVQGVEFFGSPARCTHPWQQAGGRRQCTDAGSCLAECSSTGLWRGSSRSAGFLGRLEPAPAPAASPRVLPAPAPGRGPEPWHHSGRGCWHRGCAQRVGAAPLGIQGRDTDPAESPEHHLGVQRSPCAPLPQPRSQKSPGSIAMAVLGVAPLVWEVLGNNSATTRGGTGKGGIGAGK